MMPSAVSDRRRSRDRSFLDEQDDDLISEVRDLNRQKRKITARAPLDDADDGVVVVSGLTSEVRKASKENAIGEPSIGVQGGLDTDIEARSSTDPQAREAQDTW